MGNLKSQLESVKARLEGGWMRDDENCAFSPDEIDAIAYLNDDDEYISRDSGEILEFYPESGLDFIFSAALDFSFKCRPDGRLEYQGGEILISSGGPRIWIEPENCLIYGQMGDDRLSLSYSDEIGLFDGLGELFASNYA